MIENIALNIKLKKYHQEHLKNSNIPKNSLNNIDYHFLKKIYTDSYKEEKYDNLKISPLKVWNKTDKYTELGKNIIRNNSYAVVLLAGGSASRLNLNIPKGCLEINVKKEKISLFEIYINQLKKVYKEYNIYINLYIMTSKTNNDYIISYFKKHHYFDYPQENIKFFPQNELPLISKEGKVLLKNKEEILTGPNGNGDVYKSLKENNILNDLTNKKIKYVLFSTIDNVLVKLVDESFIGLLDYQKYQIGTKVLKTSIDNQTEWAFCKYDGKISIIPPKFITKELRNYQDKQGKYPYQHKNITHHILSTDLLIEVSKKILPYHRAFKSYEFLSPIDNKKVTEKIFKFEQFIFDGFKYSNDMVLWEVGNEEFCSIKTQEDIKKAEDALNK